LAKEQQELQNGSQGLAMVKCMKTVVEMGRAFDADGLAESGRCRSRGTRL
jgi:predicted aconitase